MSIITFYSYKGGVGRSMALANIAFELARRNKKVLMVDWDLEAPGLERYFVNFPIDRQAPGLLPLLLEFRKGIEADYKDYLWTIDIKSDNPLYLLHSGRDADPAGYSSELENFDWEAFFAQNSGGQYLERMRNRWRQEFDIVLIDSRTGLSDSSGICTILLPDVVIPMFTANYQSLFGIRDIMSYIQSARQKLSVDRMALTILPLPSRFGTRVEFQQSQEWLDRIADILKDCFTDWLPKWVEPRYVLEQIKIPQVDYFSFGEKLAVAEQGTADPESMGFIYAKLADFLASDFSAIETFVGARYYAERKAAYATKPPPAPPMVSASPAAAAPRYSNDLFIIYPAAAYQWVREVLQPALTDYLTDELGYEPHIFVSIKTSDSWNESILSALEHSAVFLFVITDTPVGTSTLQELTIAKTGRQEKADRNIIFPVLHAKTKKPLEDMPEYLRSVQITDLSAYTAEEIKSTKQNARFGNVVGALAQELAKAIREQQGKPGGDAGGLDILNRLEALGGEYESIRKTLPSGSNRTSLMQGVVDKMKQTADGAKPFLSVLTKSELPGEKLAAIAVLQQQPDIGYVDWLADRVGNAEKPFVGYQATVALYTAARVFGHKHKDVISKCLYQAFDNLKKYDFNDPNQKTVLHAAMVELDLK